ncbi:MAG: YraN family protein [Clostridiales bacterium]|nr:YraN family protein [Clostridiales bacterium]
MQKIVYGKKSEIIAGEFLKKKGLKILEYNYKNKIGEIDIVAKQKNYIVFVEVKARMSRAFGDPAEAVDFRKQDKIRKVASLYLMEHNLIESNVRFDVVTILGDENPEINHIINAF